MSPLLQFRVTKPLGTSLVISRSVYLGLNGECRQNISILENKISNLQNSDVQCVHAKE